MQEKCGRCGCSDVQSLIDDGHYDIDRYGDPDLRFDGVRCGPEIGSLITGGPATDSGVSD